MTKMSMEDAGKMFRKLKTGSSDSVGSSIAAVFIVVAFVIVVACPLIVYFVWANAVAVKCLWAWLLVPTFENLHPLTWAQAWGVSIVVAYLTHVSHTCKSEDERSTGAKVGEFIVLFLKPWIAIGVGYICAHYFMHTI